MPKLRALGRVVFRLRRLQELVRRLALIVGAVRERRSWLEVLRPIQALDAKCGIERVVDPVIGEVEISVGVDALHIGRKVLTADFHVDPDDLEGLLDVFGSALEHVGHWQIVVGELEANAALLAREAGLIEQLLGKFGVEVVARHVSAVEGRQPRVDRAGGFLRVAKPYPLLDEILVNRVRDRLPHLEILQIGIVEIELDARDDARIFVAAALDGEIGKRAKACEIVEGDRVARSKIDLARLKRGCPRRRIDNEAHDDAVEIGQAGFPVLVVADQRDVVPFHPLLKFERAGPDRRGIILVLRKIRPFVDVLRDDRRFRRGERGQQIGARLRQIDDDGKWVRRLDRGHVRERRATSRMTGLERLDRELDVFCAERLSVVPFHAVTQFESDLPAVEADIPRGRELRLKLAVPAIAEQPLGHLSGDIISVRRAGEEADEGRGLACQRHDQRSALLRLGRRLRRDRGRNENHCAEGGRHEVAAIYRHPKADHAKPSFCILHVT